MKTKFDSRVRIDDGVQDCLFCEILQTRQREIVAENDLFLAFPDNFPVNPGHSLIVPKRHVTRLADLSPIEWKGLAEILIALQAKLNEELSPSGFNYGVNEGEAAGQTIPHLHLHVIPRFWGDVAEPRGGIRNFKKAIVAY